MNNHSVGAVADPVRNCVREVETNVAVGQGRFPFWLPLLFVRCCCTGRPAGSRFRRGFAGLDCGIDLALLPELVRLRIPNYRLQPVDDVYVTARDAHCR